MKRHFNFIAIFVMAFAVLLLSGCGEKRTELKFEGEEGTIVFNVKEKAGYKISTKKEDLRTTREQGTLIGDGFKIGIEFNDDFGYFFDSDFDKIKEARKDYDDYKEVTYSKLNGVQYFYGSYNSYEIMLPCGDSKDYFLTLSVYGAKDTEEAAKTAIQNEELLDVLNNITLIKAAK